MPSAGTAARLPLHLVVTGLVATAAVTAAGGRLYELPATLDAVSIVCGLAVAGLVVYARYVLQLGWVSAPVIYLLLFWVFHFGYTFTIAVMPQMLEPIEDWQLEWLQWPNVRLAMVLGVVGAAGFVLGAGLFQPRMSRRPEEQQAAAAPAGDRVLYVVGWLFMLTGVALSFVVFAQNGGFGILGMSYLDFRDSVLEPTVLITAIDLSQFGCLLAICGAHGRRWVAPLAVWITLACLPLMLVGVRAEAMIPLVAFAIVLTHRGVRLHRGLLLAAAMASAVVIPAVAAFRDEGFANRSSVNWTDLTPLDTVMELGSTLRATTAYVDWIDRGDALLLGASYWAPLDRHFLVYVVPGREQTPYEVDERIPLRLMVEREGPFGASATGEAYYNFGIVGPLVYFAFVGVLIGWLERRVQGHPYGCAFLGFVLFQFFFNIRSDWLPMPAQHLRTALVLGACYFLGRCLERAQPFQPRRHAVTTL